MTYFYLALSCILFSAQFIFSKLYQKNSNNTLIAANWMSIFSSVWMFLIFFVFNNFTFEISAVSVLYAFFYSVISILCSISSFFAMSLGKVSTVTLYTLLGGFILPFFYGIAFLKEELTVFKVFGLILMFFSFLPTALSKDDKSKQAKSKKSFYFFLFLCISVFLLNGMISIISKAHQINENAVGTNDFLILSAVFRFMLSSVVVLILTSIKKTKEKKFIRAIFSGVTPNSSFKWIMILFLIAGGYAIMNGMGNFFSLTCAKTMDSSIQFPIISGTVVPLTAVFSWIFIKEKIKKKDMAGMVLAIAGILMFII